MMVGELLNGNDLDYQQGMFNNHNEIKCNNVYGTSF